MLAAGLAACGTVEQLSAAQKVSKAFTKVGEGKAAGLTFSVDATPEQIIAFGAATGDKVDPKSADAVSGLNFSVAVSADKPLKDLDTFKNAQSNGADKDLTLDKSVRLSYVLSDRKGTALLEYRQVDAKAFLRADAKGLVKLVGEDPSQVDAISSDLPAELKPVKDVLAGKWVSFDLQKLADDTKKFDGAKATPSTPSGQPSLDPESAKQLTNSLKDVLSRTVTFEDKGKKDGAEHIWMSAPGRQLADELLKAVKPLAAKFPQQFGKLPTSVPSTVREDKVGADLYLKDGKLSAATFDLAQLEAKAAPGVNFPVKLAFNRNAPTVEAPADAVTLTSDDIQSTMLTLLTSGATSGGKGGTAPGTPGTPALTPGKPLTPAQAEELKALGLPLAQQEMFSKLGMGYEDMKSLAQEG
ncbi:hypothetical protein ACFV6D_37395 [Kitasatospora sp. NPDC059812]|uniref:hypothetical protein n=1 Tax=Kitasatospora sp. NPDC059812 TaxID=3346958 RepID=UPI0036577D8F